MDCSICGNGMTLLLFSYVCDTCSMAKVRAEKLLPEFAALAQVQGYVIEYKHENWKQSGTQHVWVYRSRGTAQDTATFPDCTIHAFYTASTVEYPRSGATGLTYRVMLCREYGGQPLCGFVKAY